MKEMSITYYKNIIFCLNLLGYIVSICCEWMILAADHHITILKSVVILVNMVTLNNDWVQVNIFFYCYEMCILPYSIT